jgi:DNA-binding Lrp family transcriptional regulator
VESGRERILSTGCRHRVSRHIDQRDIDRGAIPTLSRVRRPKIRWKADPRRQIDVESTLAAASEVTELRRHFGKPDYFIRVAVADLAAYETFLSNHIMTIPSVGRVHSRFAMKNIKGAQTHN